MLNGGTQCRTLPHTQYTRAKKLKYTFKYFFFSRVGTEPTVNVTGQSHLQSQATPLKASYYYHLN